MIEVFIQYAGVRHHRFESLVGRRRHSIDGDVSDWSAG